MRYVFAAMTTGDICAFDMRVPDAAPETYPERVDWCRRKGKHVATLNPRSSQWWVLSKGQWELAPAPESRALTKLLEEEGFIKREKQLRLFKRQKKTVREVDSPQP